MISKEGLELPIKNDRSYPKRKRRHKVRKNRADDEG
jgi:hypothetical protein